MNICVFQCIKLTLIDLLNEQWIKWNTYIFIYKRASIHIQNIICISCTFHWKIRDTWVRTLLRLIFIVFIDTYRGRHLTNTPSLSQIMTDIVMDTSETVSDISAKPKSTAELVWNTSELKVPVLCLSFALTVT